MKRANGKTLALAVGIGEFMASILMVDQRNLLFPSTTPTLDQSFIIMVLSLFLYWSIHPFSSYFFFISLGIIVLGMLLSKKSTEFLSRYVKIHVLYVVMFFIFLSKYANDYYVVNSFDIILRLVLQTVVCILFGAMMNKIILKSFEKVSNENGSLTDLKVPLEFSCPHCGFQYHSIPLYCVKCRKMIDSP